MGGLPIFDMAGFDAVVTGSFSALSGSAVGSIRIEGTVAGSFPALTGSAIGNFDPGISGLVSGSFPALDGSAVGSTVQGEATGVVSGNFSALTGSAIGSTIDTLTVPAFRIYAVESDAHGARRMSNKDPDDVLDYAIDFTAILTEGEVIGAIETTFTDLTEETPAPVIDGSQVICWVGGGVEDTDGLVTIQATTNYGRTYERSLLIPISEL
jgi:hypothetical protein